MNDDQRRVLKEKYNGIPTADFFKDQARLASGEPLAYVIGTIPFLNATIFLDSHPLIPRPETEYWVEKAIGDIQLTHSSSESLRILDLCAGSGCIGVALLKHLTHCTVDFVEIDPVHHPTILKNIRMNGIDSARTRIHQSDLFEAVSGTYDYILTNPPYIDPRRDRTQTSVTDFEPHRALYGGVDGFAYIGRILTESAFFLRERGAIYIEHEPEQSERVEQEAVLNGLTTVTHPDQYGILRYSVATRWCVAQ